MTWEVRFAAEFEPEALQLQSEVQDQLAMSLALLKVYGPRLGRPHADTLNGSKFPNMKELRFDAAGGVWRVAFAFDPERKAIVLLVGDKSGVSEKAFYRRFIEKADRRFEHHLAYIRSGR